MDKIRKMHRKANFVCFKMYYMRETRDVLKLSVQPILQNLSKISCVTADI